MEHVTTLPSNPLWRYVSQLRLLLPLFEVSPAGQHAKELEFLYHMQQHLSLLTSGISPTLELDLRCWGPGTIDAVSQAFINNRGLFIWGTSKLGKPSNKEKYNSKLTLFLYFLVSLTLPPETTGLFKDGEACAVEADVPDIAFYTFMTHALAMLANHAPSVKLTRKSNLPERRLKVVVLDIPQKVVSSVTGAKEKAHGDNSVLKSMEALKVGDDKNKNDLLQSRWATFTAARSSHQAVASKEGSTEGKGQFSGGISNSCLRPMYNPARRGTSSSKTREAERLPNTDPPLSPVPLASARLQKKSAPKPNLSPISFGRAVSSYDFSKPAPANAGRNPELQSLVDRSEWETRPRVTPRTRLDIAKWLEKMEKTTGGEEVEDNGDPS